MRSIVPALLVFSSLSLYSSVRACTTAKDGGSIHGCEPQVTSTITTLLAQSNNFLVRQNLHGVSVNNHSYTFTEPSVYKYGPSQWLWDSTSAVLTNSNYNLSIAVQEFETLFLTQDQTTGFMHETNEFPSETGNEITQIPVVPFGLKRIFEKTNDLSLLKTYIPKLYNYFNWWKNTRSLDDNYLVTIIHPWESGIDASPAYDLAWGLKSIANNTYIAWLELYPLLAELKFIYKTVYKWNITEITSRKTAPGRLLNIPNWFMVQDIAVNVVYAYGWKIIHDLSKLIYTDNNPILIESLQNYENVKKSILSLMWDKQLKQFVTLYKDVDGIIKQSNVLCIQSLFPILLLDNNTRSNNTVYMEQYTSIINAVKDETKFNTQVPFPSVSFSESTYTPIYKANLMWRGPTWGFTNWLVLEGLYNAGELSIVNDVVNKWTQAVFNNGIWEMWNAQTGVGYGAEGLGMSSLIVDWLYRLGHVTEKNIPTPPQPNKISYSHPFGYDPLTNFDDHVSDPRGHIFLNATGENCVIDQIQVSFNPERKVFTSLNIVYGDLRSPAFHHEHQFIAQHNPLSENDNNTMNTTNLIVDSMVINRGVRITGLITCVNDNEVNNGLYWMLFSLSDGSHFSFGDRSLSASFSNLNGLKGEKCEKVSVDDFLEVKAILPFINEKNNYISTFEFVYLAL